MKIFLRLVAAALTAQTFVVASASTHANVRSLLNEAEAGAISPHISRIKDIKDPFQLRQSLMTMEIFTDRSTWEAAVGPPSWEAAFPSEGTHSSLAIECGGTAAAHEVFTLEQSTTFFFITPAVVVLKPVVNEVTASMNFTKPVTAWCGDFDLGRGGLGQGLDLNIDLVCPGGTVVLQVPTVIGLAFFGIKVGDSSDPIEQIVFEGSNEAGGNAETFELSGVGAVEANDSATSTGSPPTTTTTTTTTGTSTTTTDSPATTVAPPTTTASPPATTTTTTDYPPITTVSPPTTTESPPITTTTTTESPPTTTTTTTTESPPIDLPPTATDSPPCCTGDPHFMTFHSSEWFDFHGECDLVFLNAPNFANGTGLTIHIRTTARAQFSYIESAVIKIGSNILQVNSWGDYVVDGVAMASMPAVISGFPVTHDKKSAKHHMFHIHLNEHKHIIVQTFKDIVSVKLNGPLVPEDYDGSLGLLGDFHTGEWIGRNGTIILEADDFGKEWQVLDTEDMLFATARDPQYPMQCNMPDPNKAQGRRRLGESIAEEAANHACQHWGTRKTQCVFDVMATGDIELAAAGAF